MKLWSDSWVDGERIPTRFAAGRLDAQGGVGFFDNLNPHLAWSEVPTDLARFESSHCVMVDLPGARPGLNDYTGWFADDPEMAGDYFGNDGPYPPFNDSLIHHHVFTVDAPAVARAPIEGNFTGLQVRQAIYGHILAEATHSGTYTLNQRLIRA